MALTKAVQDALARANRKLADWADGRIDDSALDVARLYKASRDTVTARLRHIYDTYLQDEPTVRRAQTTQAGAEIQAAIDETINELTTRVGQRSVDALAELGGTTARAVNRFLKPYLGVGVEELPVSSAWVFQELSTSVVGGGTYLDRLFHIGENLKSELTRTIRQGLISGAEFDDLRSGVMKSFGVDQLAEPKFNAYGSVKIFKNEARRQWNLLMSDQAERVGGVEVWFSKLGPTTTPGCAARHGKAINELGETPPRHYNCQCTVAVFPGEVDLAGIQANGGAWLSSHGYTRKAAMLEEATAFDPAEHPRDDQGRFADDPGGTRAPSAERVSKQVDDWVEELGAKVNGIQDSPKPGHPGYLVFTDRDTGSTMLLDLRDVTRERIQAKIAQTRAGFRQEAAAPWWGPHELVRVSEQDRPEAEDPEGAWRYLATPWRALPLVLRDGLRAPVTAPSLLEARRRADPDAVALRFPMRPKRVPPHQIYVLTADEGWVPLHIKGAVYIENPSGLFAADSPTIQRWEPSATKPAAGTLLRFPGLRTLALRNDGERWQAAVLSREDALPWAFGGTSSRTEPRPRGVVSGRYFPGVVDQALADFGFTPDPHLCVWDVRGLRLVCRVESGIVLYARERFSNPEAYQRVAVYCPDGLGVWAIRPPQHPYFVLPGGHIEPHETRLQAAQREMREETGIPVTPTRYLGAMHRPWATTHVFLATRSGPTETPTTRDEIAQRAVVPLDMLDPSERVWLQSRVARLAEAAAFDPAEHPRKPAGSEDGGQFTAAPGGAAAMAMEIPQAQMDAMHKRFADRLREFRKKYPSGFTADTVYALGAVPRAYDQSKETWAFADHVAKASNDDEMINVMDSKNEWSTGYSVATREWLAAAALGGNGQMSNVTKEYLTREEPYVPPERKKARPLGAEEKKAFQARQAWTQAYVRKKYGDEITVYRGIRGAQAKKITEQAKKGDEIDLPVYALSSWSTDRGSARNFAMTGPATRQKLTGVVVKMTIKPEEVWLAPKETGPRGIIQFSDDYGELVTLNKSKTRKVTLA